MSAHAVDSTPMGGRNLIRDANFKAGFILLDPTPGARRPYGKLPGTVPGQAPVWDLCQWSTRHPLATGTTAGLVYKNRGKLVAVAKPDNFGADLVLDVNASAEYPDRARRAREPWVHLLVQQQFTNPPALSELQSACFSIQMRLRHSKRLATPDYSPGLHAAQFQVFFTIQNLSRKSADYGQLIWFGIPLYDDRSRFPPEHKQQDTGGTSMFIYTPSGQTFCSQSAHDGKWIKVEKDLLPLMKEALNTAWDRGFLKASRNLAGYRISGMNMGWEVPGTFDVGAEVRGLGLTVK